MSLAERLLSTGPVDASGKICIGALATPDALGQAAFPDSVSHLKIAGAGSHSDGSPTLVAIDASGKLMKTGGTYTTINAISNAIVATGTVPATPTTLGIVYGKTEQNNAGAGQNYNTILGYGSASTLSSGTNNTILGSGANVTGGSTTNSISLGINALASDNQFALSDQIFNIKAKNLETHSSTTPVLLAIDSNGLIKRALGTNTSVGAIDTAINSKQSTSEKGQPSGYCDLDSSTLVPENRLPLGTFTNRGVVMGTTDPISTNNNTFLGYNAGAGTYSGAVGVQPRNNVAIGMTALASVISGSPNTAQCVAVGSTALQFATGQRNIGIGFAAGATLTTGGDNILIGSGADVVASNTNGGIALGSGAKADTNQLAVNDSVQTLKFVGLATQTDATSTIITIDSSGIIRKANGTNNTISKIDTYLASTVVKNAAVCTTYYYTGASQNMSYGTVTDSNVFIPPFTASTTRGTGLMNVVTSNGYSEFKPTRACTIRFSGTITRNSSGSPAVTRFSPQIMFSAGGGAYARLAYYDAPVTSATTSYAVNRLIINMSVGDSVAMGIAMTTPGSGTIPIGNTYIDIEEIL
jgi:hypothetical protein